MRLPETYQRFADGVRATRSDAPRLPTRRRGPQGGSVAGYGAPAKATTLLNYCGIGPESIEYTVDRNPLKQGRTVPGTGIPILAPEQLGADPSGLRGHPALEPPGRDRHAARRGRLLGRAARRPCAAGGAAHVIFETGAHRRSVHDRHRARRGRARPLRAHLLRGRVPPARARDRPSRSARRVLQPGARDPARPAPPGTSHDEVKLVRCTRGAIYDVIARPAGRVRQRLGLVRSRARRHRGPRALRPERVRSRLPDARSRHRGQLPAVSGHARMAVDRRALERSGVRNRVAARGHGDLGG